MQQALSEIGGIAWRVLTEQLRARRNLVFWAVFPTLMLLLFGLIYAGNGRTGSSFDRVAPGILIGAALFFSCLGGPVSVIVGERERGTLRRLLLTPMRPTSYFFGIALAHAAIAVAQAVVVLAVAAVFGGRFHGSPLLGLAIVALSTAAFVGVGFHFGARFSRRTEDVNGPVAAFGVPLLVLGGTFFPTQMLPSFLRTAALADPIYHMNEALKPVWALGAGAAAIADHLTFLVAFSILSVLLGARSYRAMLTHERRIGS